MAEGPLKLHLYSHPKCLRIHGPWVYEDENQRTWLPLFTETGGVVQVRFRQEAIPSGHNAVTKSVLTSSIMPSIWTLHSGSQYEDHMHQFWRIVHHVRVDGVEEMILELKKDA